MLTRLSRSAKQAGYSLIEVLVSLSVVSIIALILVPVLFTQYAGTLAESAKIALRNEGQALLINLQDELLFTIAYGQELEDRLFDTYEPSGGWTHDTSPETLIINEISLDSTRRDDSRNIIRQRVNDCEASAVSSNPLALNNVIYFVEPNANNDFSTLYRRTVVPDYNFCSVDTVSGDPCTPVTATCRTIAKEQTCPATFVGVGSCARRDSLLTDNVIDFSIRYFAENNVETVFPSAADKIEVTLVLGDVVYGKDISTTVNHTIRKIN